MNQHLSNWRVGLVAAILVCAIAFGIFRKEEQTVSRTELAAYPSKIGNWNGIDVGVALDVREVLGPGDYLSRLYNRQDDERAIDLFIAYFPSQRRGSMAHSPKLCLPGAGWVPVESTQTDVALSSGRSIHVNRYVVQKDTNRNIIFYWYASHGRAIASEYWSRAYLVADAIRFNRTDGALVRISTLIHSNESQQSAEQRAIGFIRELEPTLHPYIPN